MIKLFTKYLVLFFIGGTIYVSLEHIWRGWSHWTMFILGGICFIALGLINEVLDWNTPMVLQMAIGCAIITTLEFITGCVVNIGLGWDVWDYSQYPLNFLGQISVGSSVLWYFLSAVGIVLDDTIRWKAFGEDKPKYKWI
jgi:uncharacterized membrane protein